MGLAAYIYPLVPKAGYVHQQGALGLQGVHLRQGEAPYRSLPSRRRGRA
jgi:hypothetical protein